MKFVPNEIAKYNSGLTRVIPVLASFDNAGNVRPVYIRINSEAYKVLSCYSQDYGSLTIFTCTVNSGGMQRQLRLTYHDQDRCWTTQL